MNKLGEIMNQNKYLRILDTKEITLEKDIKLLNENFDTKLIIGFLSPPY